MNLQTGLIASCEIPLPGCGRAGRWVVDGRPMAVTIVVAAAGGIYRRAAPAGTGAKAMVVAAGRARRPRSRRWRCCSGGRCSRE